MSENALSLIPQETVS